MEELRARVAAKVKQLAAGPNDGVDAFHRDALAFFSRVPEPPVYRRRDDPTRAQAAEMLGDAETLLARASRLGSEVNDFAAALEAHHRALTLMSEGRVELAEAAWHEALAKERAATAPLRLWSRTDEGRPAVFDAQTRRSRFDPRPDAQVEVKLACPACRKVSQFTLSPRVASHSLECVHCRAAFVAYIAELRALEVQQLGRNRRRYRFRVDELGGLPTVVEFDDATHGGELGAVRRDLLAFLYRPETVLVGVLNLNSSRVLWVTPPGACFVATVAFGEGAPELTALRAFRDRVLERSAPGRAFVDWYYRDGEALAAVVGRSRLLTMMTRGALRQVVRVVEKIE
ncbi:MAG: CFI-box-CTERM domain-containing protein [Myxococcota bacterium]